jgi:bifunctional UDP-N-acetylglucosamine pyrophosphorylase/glucosamine-1-phosphate N-acetyltransferase
MPERAGRVLVVPAAGRGSRLQSPRPKALVPVNGRPMLDHLTALYAGYVDRVIVVAHPSFAREIEQWGSRQTHVAVDVAEQTSPTGMLDAILLAAPAVSRASPEWVWITWCDQIGALPATVERLARETSVHGCALVMPTVRSWQPYIHLERDATGRITRVLHNREGDAMPDEGESDMGLFALARVTFDSDLVQYSREPAIGSGTGERNFLPFIPWLAARATVATFASTDRMEALGVNTPEDLSVMEAWLRERGR